MRKKAIFVIVLVFVFFTVIPASAAITPAPAPNTRWISGAAKLIRPAAGWTCWGDAIGPHKGPVVVRFTKRPPTAWTMRFVGCAYEPTITKERRALWAKNKYGRIFKVVDYK